jgi:hypothetical protein
VCIAELLPDHTQAGDRDSRMLAAAALHALKAMIRVSHCAPIPDTPARSTACRPSASRQMGPAAKWHLDRRVCVTGGLLSGRGLKDPSRPSVAVRD